VPIDSKPGQLFVGLLITEKVNSKSSRSEKQLPPTFLKRTAMGLLAKTCFPHSLESPDENHVVIPIYHCHFLICAWFHFFQPCP
jgi:hypothetical protein